MAVLCILKCASPTAHLNTSYRHFYLFITEVSLTRYLESYGDNNITLEVRSCRQERVGAFG